MRPLEQYTTLRKGQEIMLQLEEEAWKERIARLKATGRNLAHWLGMRLVRWGYKLEQYSMQPGESAA